MRDNEFSLDLQRYGLSNALLDFIAQEPAVRSSIASFLLVAAKWTEKSATLIDIGAGSAPFREMFDVAEYITVDWNENAPISPSRIDIRSPADAIPLQDEIADVIIMTELLEHTFFPQATLREALRLMKPGARIFGTTPFAWEFHEMPHDYFRYTPSAIARLCHEVGLQEVTIEERGSMIDVVRVLERKISYAFRDDLRTEARAALSQLSDAIDAISDLEQQSPKVLGGFPLGLSFTAIKPITG
jgi:hypothetical protein